MQSPQAHVKGEQGHGVDGAGKILMVDQQNRRPLRRLVQFHPPAVKGCGHQTLGHASRQGIELLHGAVRSSGREEGAARNTHLGCT